MSAVIEAPDVTLRYACTECVHPPFSSTRAIAIHQVRRHNMRNGIERAGKAVVVEVPLDETAPVLPFTKVGHLPEMETGYHTSALKIPLTALAQIDYLIKQRGYGNRTEVVREAVQFFLGAIGSESWQTRYVVEHRKRIAAEEKCRRLQESLGHEINRLTLLQRS